MRRRTHRWGEARAAGVSPAEWPAERRQRRDGCGFRDLYEWPQSDDTEGGRCEHRGTQVFTPASLGIVRTSAAMRTGRGLPAARSRRSRSAPAIIRRYSAGLTPAALASPHLGPSPQGPPRYCRSLDRGSDQQLRDAHGHLHHPPGDADSPADGVEGGLAGEGTFWGSGPSCASALLMGYLTRIPQPRRRTIWEQVCNDITPATSDSPESPVEGEPRRRSAHLERGSGCRRHRSRSRTIRAVVRGRGRPADGRLPRSEAGVASAVLGVPRNLLPRPRGGGWRDDGPGLPRTRSVAPQPSSRRA